MPGLTVTEKSHWRDRIAARIEKAAERVRARHPALFDRVRPRGPRRGPGLAGPGRALRRAGGDPGRGGDPGPPQEAAQRSMVATLRSIPVDEVADTFSVRYGSELALPVRGRRGDRPAAGGPPGPAPGRRPGRPRDRPAGVREGQPAGHGLAGGLAGPDQAIVGEGRRAARRRADGPGARGAGHRAGEGGLRCRGITDRGGGRRAAAGRHADRAGPRPARRPAPGLHAPGLAAGLRRRPAAQGARPRGPSSTRSAAGSPWPPGWPGPSSASPCSGSSGRSWASGPG